MKIIYPSLAALDFSTWWRLDFRVGLNFGPQNKDVYRCQNKFKGLLKIWRISAYLPKFIHF